jgi:Na+/melibiose symporter-like transporter
MGRMMIIFFMILALVFLITGGIGLFYTNVNLGSGTTIWVIGNLAFGTFAFFGVAILVFIALFNAEFD